MPPVYIEQQKPAVTDTLKSNLTPFQAAQNLQYIGALGGTYTQTGGSQGGRFSPAQIEQAQKKYAEEYQKVVTPNIQDPHGYYKDVAAVVPGGVLLNPESMKGTGYDTAKYREYVIGSIVSQYITPEQRAVLEKNPNIPRDYFGGSWVERKEEKPTSIVTKAFPTGYETAVFGEGGKLISGESTVFSKRTAFMGAGKPNVPSDWLFSTKQLENVFVNLETGQYVSVALGGSPPTTGTYRLIGGGLVSSTKELFGATPLVSGGVTEFIPVTGTTGSYTSPLKQTVLSISGTSEWADILSFVGKTTGRTDIGTKQDMLLLPLWMRPDEQPSQPAPKDFSYDWLRVGTPSADMFSQWIDMKLSTNQNEFVGVVGAYMVKPSFVGMLSLVDFARQAGMQAPQFSLYFHQTGESAPYEAYTGKQLQTLGLGILEVTTPLGVFIGTKEARESLIPIGTTVGTQIGYMLTHPLETAGSTLVFGAVMPQIGGIWAHRRFTVAGFESEAVAKSELFISKNVPEVEFPIYTSASAESRAMLKPNLDEYMSISSAFKGQNIKYIGMGDQPVMFGFEHWQTVLEGRSVGFTNKLSPVDVSEVSQKYVSATKGVGGGNIGDLGIDWYEKAVTSRTGTVVEDIGGGVVSFRARQYDISGPTVLFKNTLIDFEPEGLVKVTGVTGTQQFSYRLTAGREGIKPYLVQAGDITLIQETPPTYGREGLLYDTLGIRNNVPNYITKNIAGYFEFDVFKRTANFFDMETGISTNVPVPVGAVNVKVTSSLAMPVSISEFTPARLLAAESTYGVRGGGAHTPWSATMPDYVDFINLGGGTASAVTTKGATISEIGIPFVSYEAGAIVAKTTSLTIPSVIAGSIVATQGRTMRMTNTGIATGTSMRTVNLVGQPSRVSERLAEFTQQPEASRVKVIEFPASTQIFKQSEFQMPVTRETTREAVLQEARQVNEQIFKEMQMPVTKEAMKEMPMQLEKIMQLQETRQVQEQIFTGVAPFGKFDVWQPPPPPPPKSGKVDLDLLQVPKSGFRGLKQLRGRGSPLPFADILSVQRTQMRFGGRSTELPINIKTLGKWREAAGSGFGRGFPTLELSKARIIKKSRRKRRRRLI
jgi:hypothetical protein